MAQGKAELQSESVADGQPVTSRKHGASLSHGLRILDMYSHERPEISIGEMGLELGLHKSMASRLAATLADAGYLRASSTQGSYRLGGRLRALGNLTGEGFDLVQIVLPHLKQLTEVTGETGHLAVLSGSEARTEAVTDGWHTIRMHSWAGKTSPAYASSMGKMLLAALDDNATRELYADHRFQRTTENSLSGIDALLENMHLIRTCGYGFDDEELEIGMRCISAPVVDSTGAVVASISISAPSQRFLKRRVPEIAQHVMWYAAAASRDLGATLSAPKGWPVPPHNVPPPLSYLESEAARRLNRGNGKGG